MLFCCQSSIERVLRQHHNALVMQSLHNAVANCGFAAGCSAGYPYKERHSTPKVCSRFCGRQWRMSWGSRSSVRRFCSDFQAHIALDVGCYAVIVKHWVGYRRLLHTLTQPQRVLVACSGSVDRAQACSSATSIAADSADSAKCSQGDRRERSTRACTRSKRPQTNNNTQRTFSAALELLYGLLFSQLRMCGELCKGWQLGRAAKSHVLLGIGIGMNLFVGLTKSASCNAVKRWLDDGCRKLAKLSRCPRTSLGVLCCALA